MDIQSRQFQIHREGWQAAGTSDFWTQPTKVAGTLRRAVCLRILAGFSGGRHMECACYVASEPLVLEPSGVCWDERGDLYVFELHGYNLEGQYDIEELNKTGQIDRVVRRIQADERHKEAAEAGTYGTIKS